MRPSNVSERKSATTTMECLWDLCSCYGHLKCLALLEGTTPLISSLSVSGREFGKESSVTPVNKSLAVLPLPSVLQLADALLSCLVSMYFASILQQVSECFVWGTAIYASPGRRLWCPESP